MKDSDYWRFHNFLNGHGCKLDFREFRNAKGQPAARQSLAVALKPSADTSTEPLTRVV
jgi:hypothetical protein